VSTAARDEWPGRLADPAANNTDGQMATLERPSCGWQNCAGSTAAIVIAIRGVTYYLDQPLELVPADSGTEHSPTIYTAFGDQRPVLSGGVPIAPNGELASKSVGKRRWMVVATIVCDDQRRYRPPRTSARVLPNCRAPWSGTRLAARVGGTTHAKSLMWSRRNTAYCSQVKVGKCS
jgi:hypothetical protein